MEHQTRALLTTNLEDSIEGPAQRVVETQEAAPAGADTTHAPPFLRRVLAVSWPFLVLLVGTVAVWARPVIGHFATRRLSTPGADSESFAFYLSWNIHALTHFENPFFTPNLYAPNGLDLGNAISIPSVSVLVSPVTLLFGGTAGFNTALLLAVFLGAASVYLLAWELTASKVGATVAGLLMVVSPYFTGHNLGHLNLMWIFGVPLVGYLVARFTKGTLRGRWLVVWVALTTVFTLGASTELFVIEPLFMLLALAVALAVVGREHRKRLLRSVPYAAIGGVVGIILGLPVIIAGLTSGIPDKIVNPPEAFSSDFTNIFAPTKVFQFGESYFQSLWPTWLGNDAENTAYIPATLLLLVLAYGFASRSRLAAGTALYALIALIASLGPVLRIAGQATLPMPWAYVERIKGLDHALPGRFSAFVFMALLIMVADAWARRVIPRAITALAVGASILLLLPNLEAMGFPTDTTDKVFVTSGRIASVISPDENVLVVPVGQWGPGMRWEVALDFGFRMPTGNGGGAIPPEALKDPVASALYHHDATYPFATELLPYLDRVGVHTVIVDGDRADWKQIMDGALRVPATDEGGVWVYRLD